MSTTFSLEVEEPSNSTRSKLLNNRRGHLNECRLRLEATFTQLASRSRLSTLKAGGTQQMEVLGYARGHPTAPDALPSMTNLTSTAESTLLGRNQKPIALSSHHLKVKATTRTRHCSARSRWCPNTRWSTRSRSRSGPIYSKLRKRSPSCSTSTSRDSSRSPSS